MPKSLPMNVWIIDLTISQRDSRKERYSVHASDGAEQVTADLSRGSFERDSGGYAHPALSTCPAR